MNQKRAGQALIRMAFWAVVAVLVFSFAINSYLSGEMTHWYYYKASTSGYAINDNSFLAATKDKPILLQVVAADQIVGQQAVKVSKGDLLPTGANGVIAKADVQDGKRVALEGSNLKVMVPTQIKEQSGIKYSDTYRHKGIETNPLSGPWNVGVVLLMGLSLGMLAQAFTDLFGLEFKPTGQTRAH
ncbi:MAG: hypothetical protein M0Z94_14385 [Dehalococcoidales bacterium]|nr:hypothetical protein [Dehalococcoidales bacterium]